MIFNSIINFKKIAKYKYLIFVSIACSFAFLSIGTATAWASPSFVKLTSKDSPIPMSNDEMSWTASFLAIGGLTASIPYSYLLNKIGRKPMIILVSIFYIAGWFTMIFAESILHLYIARYFLGAGVGCTFASIPVFIGEVVETSIRGAIVTALSLSSILGSVLTYGIGPLIPFQLLNIISIGFPVLMLICFIFMPETPYFLLKNGDYDGAVTNLMKFRGCEFTDEVDEELKYIQQFLEETKSNNFFDSLKELAHKKSRKAIIIITVLLIGQQASGLCAMSNFMESLFNEIELPIESNIAVLICEILAIIPIIGSSVLMDSFGRKPLYTISCIICIIANIFLGLFYMFKANGDLDSTYSWIPMVSVFIIRMGYEVGLSAVPMVVTSEILSFNIKGLVSAYFAFVQGSAMAIVLKIFQIVKDETGQHNTHWIFAISVFLTMLFILYYMPETKNKSLAEIQRDFDTKHEEKMNKSVI